MLIDRDATGLEPLSRGEAGHEWALHPSKCKLPIAQEWVNDVLDIMGECFSGLYNAQISRSSWNEFCAIANNGNKFQVVEFVVHGELSTYDGNDLTQLVVLCHDRAIRLAISPCNMRYLRLSFTPRERNSREFWRHHPNIERGIDVARYFRRGRDLREGK